MKRKLYVVLLCVAVLVTGCEQGHTVVEEVVPELVVAEDELNMVEPENEPEDIAKTITEMLNSIPHPGIRDVWSVDVHPIVDSETSRELATFISEMISWLTPPPTTSFTSPAEIDQEFALGVAFVRTSFVQGARPEWENYHPELAALAPFLEPPFGIYILGLHNHMEETARILFGSYVVLNPPTTAIAHRAFRGNAASGAIEIYGNFVYGPIEGEGAWGGALASLIPVILSYEYIGNGYEIKCIFVRRTHYHDVGEHGFLEHIGADNSVRVDADRDEIADYLLTSTDIHTITLKRNENGGLYYWAHILP